MTRITCVDACCKYLSDDWICTRNEITLSWSDVATVNDGRQHFHRCKNYEESEYVKRLEGFFADYIKHLDKGGEPE